MYIIYIYYYILYNYIYIHYIYIYIHYIYIYIIYIYTLYIYIHYIYIHYIYIYIRIYIVDFLLKPPSLDEDSGALTMFPAQTPHGGSGAKNTTLCWSQQQVAGGRKLGGWKMNDPARSAANWYRFLSSRKVEQTTGPKKNAWFHETWDVHLVMYHNPLALLFTQSFKIIGVHGSPLSILSRCWRWHQGPTIQRPIAQLFSSTSLRAVSEGSQGIKPEVCVLPNRCLQFIMTKSTGLSGHLVSVSGRFSHGCHTFWGVNSLFHHPRHHSQPRLPIRGADSFRVWFLWDLDPHIQQWSKQTWLESIRVSWKNHPSIFLGYLDISGYFWRVGYVSFSSHTRRDITKSGRRPDPLGGWASQVALEASSCDRGFEHFRVLSIP